MKTLTTAIFGKKAGSSFNTAIGGRLYKGIAPEGATYPYAVFKVVNDRPDDTFTESLEDVSLQFSIFSSSSSTNEIETIYGYLKSLYDKCSFTITGATLLYMLRENASLIIEEHTVPSGIIWVWHYAIMYSIKTKVG